MKKALIFFSVFFCLSLTGFSQIAEFSTLKVETPTVSTHDGYTYIQSYFLENFPEKVSQFIYDETTHVVEITTSLQPIDVLQILRKLGYESVYQVSAGERYSLSPDALKLKFAK